MAKPTRQTRSNSVSDMSIDQKLDLLLSEISDIKNYNKQFKDDILGIKDDLKQLKADVNESIDLCFNKIKDCEVKLQNNSSRISESEEVIQGLISENNSLKKQLGEAQRLLRSTEQYSRSNCLEIHGVPEERSESVIDVVKKVGRVLNFEVKEDMIDAVHRLAKNTRNPTAHRGIIVKFCRRVEMEQFRAKTRVKNGFSASELGYKTESRVFVNLSLSKDTRILWAETRAFRKQRNYKYAWISSSGKIFLRKEEGLPPILISESADLQKLK